MRAAPIASLAIVMALTGCGGAGAKSDRDRAVAAAQVAYQQAKASGLNLAPGPCIAEQLPGLSDWVVDIAHNPRIAIDNLPKNQCARFLSGQAHHFVELTPEGQLIRAQ